MRYKGVVNDLKGKTTLDDGRMNPAYKAWTGVMQRSLDDSFKLKRPTYQYCDVCEDWYLFSNFYDWYSENLYDSSYTLQVDKDLKEYGNKVYSPDKCLLVEPRVNIIISGLNRPKQGLPIGVCSYKDRNKKFKAQINLGNGQKQMGAYYTAMEAHRVWQELKVKRILEIAREQVNIEVKNCLLNFADIIISDINLNQESKFN